MTFSFVLFVTNFSPQFLHFIISFFDAGLQDLQNWHCTIFPFLIIQPHDDYKDNLQICGREMKYTHMCFAM